MYSSGNCCSCGTSKTLNLWTTGRKKYRIFLDQIKPSWCLQPFSSLESELFHFFDIKGFVTFKEAWLEQCLSFSVNAANSTKCYKLQTDSSDSVGVTVSCDCDITTVLSEQWLFSCTVSVWILCVASVSVHFKLTVHVRLLSRSCENLWKVWQDDKIIIYFKKDVFCLWEISHLLTLCCHWKSRVCGGMWGFLKAPSGLLKDNSSVIGTICCLLKIIFLSSYCSFRLLSKQSASGL